MPRIRIDSMEDERVAAYRDLASAQLTRQSGLFVAEGRLLVERLIASSYTPHSILVDERRIGLLPDTPPDVPVYTTSKDLIEHIAGFEFHRGVLACGYRQPLDTTAGVCRELRRSALIVGCVAVQDPTNLGGILRSCAAFGVDAVLVSKQSADPFARRVLRVSMGASLSLPIVETDDVAADLQELRSDNHFQVVATVVDNATSLESATRAERTVLLIGSEADGLPESLVANADRRVTIPMSLQTDSLNASVAAGVLLYHFTRVAGSEA